MMATEYLSALGSCLDTPMATLSAFGPLFLNEAMMRWVNHVVMTRDRRARVHLVGNGGSASVVAHAQNDLVKACGVRALVYQDVPLLTAFANDHGYHKGYSDALSIWLEDDDVLIAVSSSGASQNILNAVRVAKDIGATVVTCTGFQPDNTLRQLGHLNFYVPSSDYGQVEITHAALLHCLTDQVKQR